MTPRHQIPASNDRDDAGTPCPSPIDLAAWCDGSLEDERSGAIALHLSECARCRVAVGADEATVPQAAASARGAPLVDGGRPAADATGEDDACVARVIWRAESLVDAPAPLPFARVLRTARGAVAIAATLAAAFAGWNAAAYLMSQRAGGATDEPIVVADSNDALSTTIPPSTNDASAAPDASALASGAAADDDSDADELASLLTFGLLDDRGDASLVETTNHEPIERSDS